jgi:hypothetical protein
MDPVTRSPELLGGNWGTRRTSPVLVNLLGWFFVYMEDRRKLSWRSGKMKEFLKAHDRESKTLTYPLSGHPVYLFFFWLLFLALIIF